MKKSVLQKNLILLICFFLVTIINVSPHLNNRVKKFAANNNNIFINAEFDFQESIVEKKYYNYEINNDIYYVSDDFKVDSNTYQLIRVISNTASYPYEGSNLISNWNTALEIQTYNPIKNNFIKNFYPLTDRQFEYIQNNSITCINKNDEIYEQIRKAFLFEFEYKSQISSDSNKEARTSSVQQTLSSTDNQTILDEYKNTFKKRVGGLGISVDGSHIYTTDDPITTLIPKNIFSTLGTYSYLGKEWGYYANTKTYSSTSYFTELFIIDIQVEEGDEINFEQITVTPIVNDIFKYDLETDVVSYLQTEEFCIRKPEIHSYINYIDQYDWEYNEYDEIEYYPITEHMYNPYEVQYDVSKDFGCIFSKYGATCKGQLRNGASYTNLNKFYSYVLDAANFVITSGFKNEYAKLFTGFVIDKLPSLIGEIKDSDKTGKEQALIKDGDKYYFETEKDFSLNSFESDMKNNKKRKNYSIELNELDDLLFKRNTDYINFYSKILYSKNQNAYKFNSLIGHEIKLPIYKDKSILTIKNFEKITNMSNQYGYLYKPYDNTDNFSIRENPNDQEQYLRISKEPLPIKANFTADEECDYIFFFDHLKSDTRIVCSDGSTFDSGRTTGKLTDLADDLHIKDKNIPIYDNHKKQVSLKKYEKISFNISRGDELTELNETITIRASKITKENHSFASTTPNQHDILKLSPTLNRNHRLYSIHTTSTNMYTLAINSKSDCYCSMFNSKGQIIFYNPKALPSISRLLLNENETYYFDFFGQGNNSCSISFLKGSYLPDAFHWQRNRFRNVIEDNVNCSFIFIPKESKKYQIYSNVGESSALYRIYDTNNTLLASAKHIRLTYEFKASNIYILQFSFDNNNADFMKDTLWCFKEI